MIDRLNAALSERYRILEQIGEGGMATVFLAEDLKHERKVALKVLKPELAAVVGGERFLTEIKTTANLQHPHILPLYDSGQAESFLFYVMPYVRGPTLRERLEEEKQLPVDEAVGIATAVANALDFAHREGVVHRDIKPANILFQDGQPVVSDFGIALAVGAGGGARLTETGLSLGTPYYMSPEQATGDQQVGPRSDIYSLGCVLYEMLTGDPPYMGSTAQAVLGQIIAGQPVAATTRRKSVPSNIDAAVRCTLAKLPADRFGTAQELVSALGNPAFRYGEDSGGSAASGARLWKTVAGVSALVAVAALGWAVIGRGPSNATEPRQYRLEWPRAADQFRAGRISPDGSLMAWVFFDSVADDGMGTGETRIWLQSWDGSEATAIPGTEGAWALAFSPDGGRLAFSVQGDVKILDLGDREVRTVASGVGAYQLGWGEDGFIYPSFSNTGQPTVVRFPATGGPIENVTDTVPGRLHMGAVPLPKGQGILYTSTPFNPDLSADSIGLRNLATGEQRILVRGTGPEYLSSGHLVWRVGEQLLAAPFDLDALELTASPKVLRDQVGDFVATGAGSVIVFEGKPERFVPELWWVDSDGTRETVDWPFPPGPLPEDLALSPDGNRIALAVPDPGNPGISRIYVKNLVDGTEVRLGEGNRPAWSQDGREVGYRAPGLEGDPEDEIRLYRQPADGSGPPAPISGPMLPAQMNVGRWSLDAPIVHGTPEGLAVLVPGQDTVSTLLMKDDISLDNPMLSPDGHWLALRYDVTGERRIFVRPYPDVGSALYPVSLRTAEDAQWSQDGNTLYYVANTDQGRDIVAARIGTDPEFRVIERTLLFPYQRYAGWSTGGWLFAVPAGGERALVSFWTHYPAEKTGLVLMEDIGPALELQLGEGR